MRYLASEHQCCWAHVASQFAMLGQYQNRRQPWRWG